MARAGKQPAPLIRSTGRLDLEHRGKLSSVASPRVPALAQVSLGASPSPLLRDTEPGKLLVAVGPRKDLQAGQHSPRGHALRCTKIALNYGFLVLEEVSGRSGAALICPEVHSAQPEQATTGNGTRGQDKPFLCHR